MRLEGLQPGKGGWFVRGVFWFLKRKLGKVPAPLRIYAHRPGILSGFGRLTRAVGRSGTLPGRLKRLAMYWTARLVECRY